MNRKQQIKYACLIGAFVSQLFLQQTFFTYTGSDRNKQLLAAKQLIDGHGLTLPQANSQNLSESVFTPLEDWPPGYSLIAVPVYHVVGDWMLCARILAVLGLLLVFLATHLLFEQHFPRSYRVYIAFFAFWGIAFTPFYYTSTSGELALGFFLLGLWAVGKMFKSSNRYVKNVKDEPTPTPPFQGGKFFPFLLLSKERVQNILPPLLFFTLSASMRYAYLPMVWILPILLLFRYIRKSPIPKSYIFISFIFASLTTYLLLGLKTPSSASGQGIFQLATHLHFENWLLWDAFPIKAFAYMSVEGLLNKLAIPAIGVLTIKLLLGVVSLFIIGLGIYFIYPFVRAFIQKEYLSLSSNHWVVVFFCFAGFIVLAMLGGLSLLHSPEIHDGIKVWTYVMETRYYALLLVSIKALLWWLIFDEKSKINHKLYDVCLIFVLLCTTYSSLHTVSRYYQRFVQGNLRETIYDTPSQRMKKIQEIVRNQRSAGKECLFVYEELIQQKDEASIAALEGAQIMGIKRFLSSNEFPEKMFVLTNIDKNSWDRESSSDKVHFLGD